MKNNNKIHRGGEMGKIVKARKPYRCDCCDITIQPGGEYIYGKARYPKYDENGEQCGVRFDFYRICADTESCTSRAIENETKQ